MSLVYTSQEHKASFTVRKHFKPYIKCSFKLNKHATPLRANTILTLSSKDKLTTIRARILSITYKSKSHLTKSMRNYTGLCVLQEMK